MVTQAIDESSGESPKGGEKPSEENTALKQELESLREALKSETQKAEAYLNQMKYLQADLENMRRRAGKEMEDAFARGRERVLLKMLAVRDDLDRALQAGGPNPQAGGLLEGVKMILSNLDKVLESEGVQPIDAVGKPFDPHLHEPAAFVKVEPGRENMIAGEIRKGYMLNGRVIRPSVVEVTRLDSKEADSSKGVQ